MSYDPLTRSGRSQYVKEMFGRIVPRYDLMNCLISLGQHRKWHTQLARLLASQNEGPVLDVATGTGDQALELLNQGVKEVVGVDFTSGMLIQAHKKTNKFAVSLIRGDALNLPFDDKSFSGSTTAFAMRNVDDIEKAFKEMKRVVRPGGQVACLDISLPNKGIFKYIFRFYFYRVVPVLGGLISGQLDAYRYLPHSLDTFPSAEKLADLMREAGLNDVSFKRLNAGALTLHVGTA